jgi:hypothetical protein
VRQAHRSQRALHHLSSLFQLNLYYNKKMAIWLSFFAIKTADISRAAHWETDKH